MPGQPLLPVFPAPINVGLIAGAAAFFLSDHPAKAPWSLAAVIGFALTRSGREESGPVGFGIAALLPWLCRIERRGLFRVPCWIVFGGAVLPDAQPAGFASVPRPARLGIGWPGARVVSVILCAGLGGTCYPLWGRPVMRWVKRPHPRGVSPIPP